MGASGWALFSIFLWFKAGDTKSSPWTAMLPSSVKGLSGSCVVIPCSFTYPDPAKKLTRFTGIWMDKNGNIFHPRQSEMQQKYQARTKLVGDAAHKNCSLMIDPIQPSDTGPFWFRIEMKGYDSFSYKEQVSISVMSKPDPIQFSVKDKMKENETVSASCSVSHSCPDSPPVFKWSHSGEEHRLSHELSGGRWNATSILTFHLTHADHNKPLQCSVTHKGGQQQRRSKILQVQYAPMNVKVEYVSDVREGQTVGLTCSSDAHPPASSYEWRNETGTWLYQGNLYIMPNISRHLGALYCTAINEVGRVTSIPVRLNVLYAPEINKESLCFSEADWVKCECVVDSNPPGRVTFKLGDKILHGTIKKNGSYFIKVQQEVFESFEFVQCWANNTQGSANLLLPLHTDVLTKSWIIIIASGASGVLVLLLIVVGVLSKCRKRSGDTAASNMSTIMTERAQSSTPKRTEDYSDSSCTGTDADVDHLPVYGNLWTEWDDPIYVNV